MTSLVLHATTVALNDAAVLITGASGTGKSGLGLELMALGCALVADDRTIVTRRGDALVVTCPPAIRNMIEARSVGILTADARPEALLRFVVTLDATETDRFPIERTIEFLGVRIPLLHKVETGYFAAAIRQYLMSGQRLP
jgi:HPr kinase/phosphorylase